MMMHGAPGLQGGASPQSAGGAATQFGTNMMNQATGQQSVPDTNITDPAALQQIVQAPGMMMPSGGNQSVAGGSTGAASPHGAEEQQPDAEEGALMGVPGIGI